MKLQPTADLVSEGLLEHLEVLDIGRLSCTSVLGLSLVSMTPRLVLVRTWIWGTLGFFVVRGLDEAVSL